MKWFRSNPTREVTRLNARIRDLETELQVERATRAVLQAEIDAMAGVIARDRARVQAELAEYHHRRALAEGMPHERNRTGAS